MISPQTIHPGVHIFSARTPTLPPATHTNSCALGERDVLLVEPATPYDDERAAWLAWAREMGSQGRRLVGILVTHHHPDHVGGAAFFARELQLPLWAHPLTIDRLTGEGATLRVDSALFGRVLQDGQSLDLAGPDDQRWTVLHTPGHAPGHVCLHNADANVIVAGDMVASSGTIVVEPRDGDMAEYLAQLDRLANLKARVAIPAHGDPIAEPTALFRHYIAHRLGREAKVVSGLGVHTAGASLDELLPDVYADTPPFLWPLAKLSLEAHLIKLERDGRARRTDRGWAPS
ncbi:MAG: MBL fold metallo-hydrolase [Polyangiaceae bacterium]|nr:MBL fold metallo-hydrolase [Polyangiaceae bacterium]